MTISINELKGDDLNAWVAKTLGYKILGKAIAYYDPESGTPSIEISQKESNSSIMGTHWRYFYVNNCECDFLKEMENDGMLTSKNKPILGHHWMCLKPVHDFSSDFSYGMPLVRDNKISLLATLDDQWTAVKGGLSITAETELEAAMKVLVALEFGEQLDENYLIEK